MNTEVLTNKLKGRIPALACVLLAIVVFIFTYVRGGLETALAESETALTTQINLMDANTRNAAELPSQVERLEKSLEVIDSMLFHPEARAINTNFFYRMEEEADVRVVQVRQGSVAAPEGNRQYATIEYTLVAEGQFTDLVQFVYNLRTVDAFIDVRQFDIRSVQGSGTAGGSGNLTLSCTVRVLARKPN